MTNEEVAVGGTYTTRVGKNTIEVRIERENAKGGWEATSLGTGKPIRIRDAKSLRPAISPDVGMSAASVGDVAAPTQRVAKPKAETVAKPKAMGCLDAAAALLKAKGEPMQCRTMIDAMKEQGVWTSDALTPHATLFSALLREINKKGDASRFKKADRGHFALRGD